MRWGGKDGAGEWLKKEVVLEGLRKEMIWCYT